MEFGKVLVLPVGKYQPIYFIASHHVAAEEHQLHLILGVHVDGEAVGALKSLTFGDPKAGVVEGPLAVQALRRELVVDSVIAEAAEVVLDVVDGVEIASDWRLHSPGSVVPTLDQLANGVIHLRYIYFLP